MDLCIPAAKMEGWKNNNERIWCRLAPEFLSGKKVIHMDLIYLNISVRKISLLQSLDSYYWTMKIRLRIWWFPIHSCTACFDRRWCSRVSTPGGWTRRAQCSTWYAKMEWDCDGLQLPNDIHIISRLICSSSGFNALFFYRHRCCFWNARCKASRVPQLQRTFEAKGRTWRKQAGTNGP